MPGNAQSLRLPPALSLDDCTLTVRGPKLLPGLLDRVRPRAKGFSLAIPLQRVDEPLHLTSGVGMKLHGPLSLLADGEHMYWPLSGLRLGAVLGPR